MASVNCLTIGLSESTQTQTTDQQAELKNNTERYLHPFKDKLQITSVPFDLDKLMIPVEPKPAIIFCGLIPDSIQQSEVAQLLRMTYPDTPIYLLNEMKTGYDRKKLVKNGFTDIFFLPIDENLLAQSIHHATSNQAGGKKSFRSVRFVDLEANSNLDFDTFLYFPMNNKYVKYTNTGDSLDEVRLNKLKASHINSVFIDSNDMEKFYQFSADRLRALQKNDTISETEKADRLQSSVRTMISGMMSGEATSTEDGKKVVEDCRHIIQSYMQGSDNAKFYERLLSISGNTTDTYSHASNVSAYAAIFALALGFQNVDDIALAGLLHDIGLVKVPPEILSKPPSAWTPVEKEIYQQHPKFSVDVIQDRKLIISDTVLKMIQQHHEYFNGTGYPKKLAATKILPEAQILTIADEFDEMTAIKPGQEHLTPKQAIEKMNKMIADNPSNCIFNPELLKKIIVLFKPEA